MKHPRHKKQCLCWCGSHQQRQCSLSRRHHDALALRELRVVHPFRPVCEAQQFLIRITRSLQIPLKTYHKALGYPPVLSVAIQLIPLWQLVNVYTFIPSRSSLQHADKQHIELQVFHLSYIVKGQHEYFPLRNNAVPDFLPILHLKGFRHRTTIPFDHIVLQTFQTCAWRAPPGRP